MDELNWPMGAALSFVMLVMLGTIVIVYNRIMGLSQVYNSFK
jgi:spermidine/putrescine transport system permease protein